jgi:hypothetical protein
MQKVALFSAAQRAQWFIAHYRYTGWYQRLGISNEMIRVAVNEHKSPLGGTAANLVNAIVGGGSVGIPFARRQAGLVVCVKLTQTSMCTRNALSRRTKT